MPKIYCFIIFKISQIVLLVIYSKLSCKLSIKKKVNEKEYKKQRVNPRCIGID